MSLSGMISAPNRQDLRGRLRDLEEGDSPKTRMEDFEALKEYLQVVAYSETMRSMAWRSEAELQMRVRSSAYIGAHVMLSHPVTKTLNSAT